MVSYSLLLVMGPMAICLGTRQKIGQLRPDVKYEVPSEIIARRYANGRQT